MQYPLNATFKLMAMSPQIVVTDSAGENVCFVQQKLFKLKEAVQVFQDQSRQVKLCDIKADRVIDWSACYHFYDIQGETFGAVRRKGMKSLWKAHYEVVDEHDQLLSVIEEENPMAKVGDALLGEVPLLGFVSGYLFHPSYLLKSTDGQPQLRVSKLPAFWEGKYRIDKLDELDPVDELRALMSFLMMSLLERQRG